MSEGAVRDFSDLDVMTASGAGRVKPAAERDRHRHGRGGDGVMTRPAEIADYLLSVDFAAIDAAGKAALAREIVTRWPDVTRHDLEAGFQIATLEAAAQLANVAAGR